MHCYSFCGRQVLDYQRYDQFPLQIALSQLTSTGNAGTKKWITNGTFSDYFTVGCKTDKGLTVILVERQDGVETKAIKTSYSSTAGTAYITFENVKVPVEIEGFSLDPEEHKRMSQYWHAGEDAAHQVRHRQIGLHTRTH